MLIICFNLIVLNSLTTGIYQYFELHIYKTITTTSN